MKNAMKKLLCLCLVAMMLLSVAPFQAFADGEDVSEGQGEAAAVENEITFDDGTAGDSGAVVYALPGELEIGNTAYIYFVVDGSTMSKVTTKVGSDFPTLPSSSKTLEYYAKVNGSSAGVAFKYWSLDVDGDPINTTGLKVGGDTYLTDNVDEAGKHYGEMNVYAVFEEVEQTTTVKLDPKEGKFAPGVSSSIEVTIGAEYPTDLPTPTRTGYTFAGWYVKDGAASAERNISNDSTEDRTVRSTAKPYAKWTKNGYTVTVMWYGNFDNGTEEDWIPFDGYEDMPIPTGSTLSTSTGTFPTDSEIRWQDLPTGYTLKGWKFLETGKDFTPGTTKISVSNANNAGKVIIVPKLQRSVTLVAQHPVKNTISTQTITVEIGKVIGELPAPTSWAGVSNDDASYTFTKWVSGDKTTDISTRENLKNTSKHPKYYPALSFNEDDTRRPHVFNAQWEESKVVILYFHTNGNTNINKATKAICYDIPASGSFNMNSLNLYKYFSDYGKYDDSVDIRDGWYDAEGWALYCQGKAAGTVCNELWDISDTRNLQELHIMLTDKGTDPNTYNNKNSTADKTNPKTGDMIVTAVVVMGLSASALAAAWYVSKKRSVR
ncbi:MAG: InlB B-repeat-containing protein [Faecousia sp.]